MRGQLILDTPEQVVLVCCSYGAGNAVCHPLKEWNSDEIDGGALGSYH